jgi:DNA helicase-2/ATP-dependent DNA helicase PcrA
MRMLGPNQVTEYRDSPLSADYAAIFEAYEKVLEESGSIDFEDILLRCVRLLSNSPTILEYYRNRFRHIMVDEYQDTNLVQVELVDLLAGGHRGLTVVGDEDQCIYSWRGADINNLIEFQKRFPEAVLIRLEENYRSTGNILLAASTVIANNTERLGKTLYTRLGNGPPIWMLEALDEHEEAQGIIHAIQEFTSPRHGYSFGDIAVFYRVSALSRNIEDALRQARIPYRVIGGVRFYDRAEIKDLVAYLQVIANPLNQLALTRIINIPKRGIGGKTLEVLLRSVSTTGRSAFDLMSNASTALDLSNAACTKLEQFAAQIARWHELATLQSPSFLLDLILQETRYIESLGDPLNPETKARIENIGELKSALVEFESQRPDATLTDWLEQVSLMNPADEVPDDGQSVSLMTIHAAKGLEFKVVFMIGLEQGLFPNMRAYTERGDMEEERRLFYVALTRARHHLVLSRTRVRLLYGQPRWNEPSGFLCELPTDLLEALDPWNPVILPMEDHPDSGFAQDEGPVVQPEIIHNGWSPSQSTSDSWLPDEPLTCLSGPTLHPAQPPRPILPSVRTPSQVTGGLNLGARVRHALLGEGTVTGIRGTKDDQRILVRFDNGTVTQLLTKYAGLEVISD